MAVRTPIELPNHRWRRAAARECWLNQNCPRSGSSYKFWICIFEQGRLGICESVSNKIFGPSELNEKNEPSEPSETGDSD